jgi:FkbM family methyltransferase
MYAQVFFDDAYEAAETRAVQALLRPGDFAIDIGANHGWYTVLMARLAGRDGAVWAFEPAPGAHAALMSNLERNHLREVVRVWPLALSDRRGDVTLHEFEDLPHGHASVSPLGRADYVTHAVRGRTLDDVLAEEAPYEPPRLVKMDVEGAELAVLRGSQRLLAAERPPIWMLEVNDETSAAFGFGRYDLIAPFADDSRYRLYRVSRAGLPEPETDVASAPHGTAWLQVPDWARSRLPRLAIRRAI